jgi:hypothetical protein
VCVVLSWVPVANRHQPVAATCWAGHGLQLTKQTCVLGMLYQQAIVAHHRMACAVLRCALCPASCADVCAAQQQGGRPAAWQPKP